MQQIMQFNPILVKTAICYKRTTAHMSAHFRFEINFMTIIKKKTSNVGGNFIRLHFCQ